MMHQAGWLLWEAGSLRMSTSAPPGRELQPLGGVDDRELCPTRELAFAVGRAGWLLAQAASPGRWNCWSSANGAIWQRWSAQPAAGVAASLGLHPEHGMCSVIDGRILHVGTTAGWQSSELPEGAVWAAPGTDGTWWALGRPSGIAPPLVWFRTRTEPRWIADPLRLSWWQSLLCGGPAALELQAVEASAWPLVLAGECSGILSDDPDSVLFLCHSPGPPTVSRLPGRLCKLGRDERDAAPLAFTLDGEVWRGTDRRWRSLGLARRFAALDASSGRGPRSVQLAWRGGSHARGVIQRWPAGQAEQLSVWSDDGCATFRQGAPGPLRLIAGWVQPSRPLEPVQ